MAEVRVLTQDGKKFFSTGESANFAEYKNFAEFEEAFLRALNKDLFGDKDSILVNCVQKVEFNDYTNRKALIHCHINKEDIYFESTKIKDELELERAKLQNLELRVILDSNNSTVCYCRPLVKDNTNSIFTSMVNNAGYYLRGYTKDDNITKWFTDFTTEQAAILDAYCKAYYLVRNFFFFSINNSIEAYNKYIDDRTNIKDSKAVVNKLLKIKDESEQYGKVDDFKEAIQWLAENVNSISVVARDKYASKLAEELDIDESNICVAKNVKTAGGFPNKYTFSFDICLDKKAVDKFNSKPNNTFLYNLFSEIKDRTQINHIHNNKLAYTLITNYKFPVKSKYTDEDREQIYSMCNN